MAETEASSGGCPFPHLKAQAQQQGTEREGQKENGNDETNMQAFSGVQRSGVDIAEVDDNPTLQEYRKIKRTMGIVTQFYKDGTELKKGHYEQVSEDIKRLDSDVEMLDEQNKALDDPSFIDHPKKKSYRNDLAEEKQRLLEQRELLTKKQGEYKELYEWSQGINRVCDWLEVSLDEYCCFTIGLPLRKDVKPAPDLDDATKVKYSEGLDEIHHNLEESQDFFSASVDGRLHKYHTIEKSIIEAQLEVVRKYPESSERRQYIEAELLKDLEFVSGNMVATPDGQKRREKMMSAHADFFKVLDYFKKKLTLLPEVDSSERTYDPKFDIWFDGTKKI
eukprot:TRINITY_DN1764_c0_g1_i1.p1 TRINITY_DN1764_c0_g1~~TRINITY_DN1764_c0_g1_i1.p1  ORF type:complete len:335 (-),score=95.64 TRINITY_DN1764_c0_g1_i1:89-1093(-)